MIMVVTMKVKCECHMNTGQCDQSVQQRTVFESKQGFPYAAWDEAGEQRDVGISDVVIGDAVIAAVADVPGAGQVILAQRDGTCQRL